MLNSLLHYIKKSPDCFHAVDTLSGLLDSEGYARLPEGGWTLIPGGNTTRLETVLPSSPSGCRTRPPEAFC